MRRIPDVTVLSEDERRLQGTTAGGQSIEYKTSGWSSEVGVTGGVKLAKGFSAYLTYAYGREKGVTPLDDPGRAPEKTKAHSTTAGIRYTWQLGEGIGFPKKDRRH